MDFAFKVFWSCPGLPLLVAWGQESVITVAFLLHIISLSHLPFFLFLFFARLVAESGFLLLITVTAKLFSLSNWFLFYFYYFHKQNLPPVHPVLFHLRVTVLIFNYIPFSFFGAFLMSFSLLPSSNFFFFCLIPFPFSYVCSV